MSPDQLAIQLLQLEKLYHERVLFNLTVLQENWGTARSAFPAGDFCVKGQMFVCARREPLQREEGR